MTSEPLPLPASPKQPEVDPLFEAAHYQEGRDLLPDGVNVPRKITSVAEFCAEAERIGLTAASLVEALSKRPEFADCLPTASESSCAQSPMKGPK